MKVVIFTHSLVSDWNHGNAHFLRGICTELILRGIELKVFEPKDGWSIQNLIEDAGHRAVKRFEDTFPHLRSETYSPETLNLDEALAGADLVLVHEWNDHGLVARLGQHRKAGADYRLLFHDTHHRSVTDRESMSGYDLSGYDGVLAFGNVIRDLYLQEGWSKQAYTWHEAADTSLFKPISDVKREGDLIWIGNWGDNERTEELNEFLLQPVKQLGLKAKVYGVRYPAHALRALTEAGIEYGGWLPNAEAPREFAKYRVTVHVPRRPYTRALPGIPTIRVFEALACGIPLISAPWKDLEGLFTPGKDFLQVESGIQMKEALLRVLSDEELASSLSSHGLNTIRSRHSCKVRVDELLEIYRGLEQGESRKAQLL